MDCFYCGEEIQGDAVCLSCADAAGAEQTLTPKQQKASELFLVLQKLTVLIEQVDIVKRANGQFISPNWTELVQTNQGVQSMLQTISNT